MKKVGLLRKLTSTHKGAQPRNSVFEGFLMKTTK